MLLKLFKGFSFKNEGMVVSHLQYTDDTLCIGKPTMDNLWMLKALVRGFEMMVGLKVNYFKSCLMGVNVSPIFLEMACNFLNWVICLSSTWDYRWGLTQGGYQLGNLSWIF